MDELKTHSPRSNPVIHPCAQNPSSIQDMFGKISRKYDLANTVLSFGIHHRWKRRLVKESQLKAGQSVLDCATGTGDLAFLFEKSSDGKARVVGCDFCEPMLAVAKNKAEKKQSKIHFEFADVMNLPYSNEEFHIASISFGIRNVKDTQKALSELGRVVKPGGKVLVLEFGQPQSVLMANLYQFYSEKVLPKVGGWVSGQPLAYKYLQTSSAQFPCGNAFLDLAHSTGKFSKSQWISFQSGIAYLYILNRI